MCVYVFYVTGALGGQKTVSDPLELELQPRCELPYRCWELNQVMQLTVDPSLQNLLLPVRILSFSGKTQTTSWFKVTGTVNGGI